ncbi:MAG: thioredoxin fold domain-containing protein [Acidobacteriota bacterium]
MKSKTLILTLALLALLLAVGGGYALKSSAAAIPWGHDYEQALESARLQSRPVITYLFTDWCTYCKQMEATTFKDPELLGKMSDKYIWVKLNAETNPEGVRLARQFAITGYPTIIVLDPEGEELDRMEGYFPSREFEESVELALSSPTSYGHLKRAVQEHGDSLALQYALGQKEVERGDLSAAAGRFRKIIETDPKNKDGFTDRSYYALAEAEASKGMAQEALSTLDNLVAGFPQSPVVADAALLRGRIHYYNGQPEKAKQVLRDYLKRYPKHTYAEWAGRMIQEIDLEGLSLASSH